LARHRLRVVRRDADPPPGRTAQRRLPATRRAGPTAAVERL
ncbi:uncharacterized protein METZ01_LOCUS346492, partial [marine metagenome]